MSRSYQCTSMSCRANKCYYQYYCEGLYNFHLLVIYWINLLLVHLKSSKYGIWFSDKAIQSKIQSQICNIQNNVHRNNILFVKRYISNNIHLLSWTCFLFQNLYTLSFYILITLDNSRAIRIIVTEIYYKQLVSDTNFQGFIHPNLTTSV